MIQPLCSPVFFRCVLSYLVRYGNQNEESIPVHLIKVSVQNSQVINYSKRNLKKAGVNSYRYVVNLKTKMRKII